MTYRLEPHEIGERSKHIMRRLKARRIFRDPSCIDRARDLVEVTAKADSEDPTTAAWAERWKNILETPVTDICRLVSSRHEDAGNFISNSPFTPEVLGLDFTDLDWRKRLYRKAGRGISLLQARMVERNDPLAGHQFLWSELNRRMTSRPVEQTPSV